MRMRNRNRQVLGWFLILRRPARRTEHKTQVTTQGGRRLRRWAEPRSVGDQSDIDEAADDHLAAAGLPARPAGYEWSVRTLNGFSTAASFYDAVSARINESAAVSSAEVLAEAQRPIKAIDDLATNDPVPPATLRLRLLVVRLRGLPRLALAMRHCKMVW